MGNFMWTGITLKLASKLRPLREYVTGLCARCRFCRALFYKKSSESENSIEDEDNIAGDSE
ncbi:MAG: hypothetical protein AAJB65_00415 [Candidatus Hodgkinia cicadicola]